MKAAKPNLARSAPALGLNCADWASKTASGRPRRSDGRSGRSAGQSGLGRVGTVVAGCFMVGRLGRRRRFGRWFLGRTWDVLSRLGRMHRPWYAERVARPRGLFPGSRAWSCAAWRELGLADRGTMFPGSLRDRPMVWTLAETSVGRNTVLAERGTFVPRPAGLRVRALILDIAVWSSLHSFGYNSFSTHPNEAIPVALES
ncbi:unnamed protein product [Microthlaspi erraticum]|uniref:Uncharacterized protein n=1 Tax=Microthlaspi erraticum TaxID=1685480 RepID=A0A6D2JQM8_9BRAS|nr:unnamed protein product [Microthlaspi erraticum]